MANPDFEEFNLDFEEVDVDDTAIGRSRDHAPLLSLSGTHGAWIHPRATLFKTEMRFHGERATMNRLQVGMGEMFNRLTESVFKPFIKFYLEDWQYKGRIIGYLYFQMVYPDNDDELHFRISENKTLKFGKREFGMIMGMTFGDTRLPSERNSRCFNETCELSEHKSVVTLKKMDMAFKSVMDNETRYRMGMVYFIYGILLANDPGQIILDEIFYIVEDEEILENFPWGEYAFTNFMCSWRKIVQDCRTRTPKEDEKPNKPQLYGCLYALQLWCFHAMPNFVRLGRHAELKDGEADSLPSYMRWHVPKTGTYLKTVKKTIKPWLNALDDILLTDREKEYVVSLGLPDSEVRAQPRVFPVPAVDEDIPRRERPEIDDEDVQARPRRRVEDSFRVTSSEPQVHLGDDIIPTVGGMRMETLMPIITRIVNEKLSEVKVELAATKVQLSEANAELGRLRAICEATSKRTEEVRREDENRYKRWHEFVRRQLQKQLGSIPVSTTSQGVESQSVSGEHTPGTLNMGGMSSGPQGSLENEGTPATFQTVSPSFFNIEGMHVEDPQDTPGLRVNEDTPWVGTATDQALGHVEDTPGVDTATDQALGHVEDTPRVGNDATDQALGHVEDTPRVDTATGQTSIYYSGGPSFIERGTRLTDNSDVIRARFRNRQSTKPPSYLSDGSHEVSMPRPSSDMWLPFKKIPGEFEANFNNWFGQPDPPKVNIPVGYVNGIRWVDAMGKAWFDRLRSHLKELEREHVDAYMELLMRKMKAHPHAFRANTTVGFSELTEFCGNACRDQNRMADEIIIPHIMNKHIKPWNLNTVVYLPWAISPGHWAAIEVSIPEWKIRVFDCQVEKTKSQSVHDCIRALSRLLWRVLETDTRFHEYQQLIDPDKRRFAVSIVGPRQVPQMITPGDCGVFAVKHIEHLLHGVSFAMITPENMDSFRHKLSVEIFNQSSDL